MAEHDEVCVLGEAADHDENHTLAIYPGEPLDKIYGDVNQDLRGHVERLEEPAGWNTSVLFCWQMVHARIKSRTTWQS